MSAMPPESCLMSNEPAFASDSSVRIRRRIFATSLLSLPRSTWATSTSRRIASNARQTRARARERAAAQQRLVLPYPRVLRLIVPKPFEARHEQPGSAARPQARVDLVQSPRARLNRQEVNQALHEAAEEALVVERRIAVGLLLRAARVVQEHEVEIGPVAELEPRELAVADDRKTGLARRRAAARRAVLRDELAARGTQRIIEHELGGIRQPVADLHQRQRAQPIGDARCERSPCVGTRESRRASLRRRRADALRRALEQGRELVARRRRIEDAVVEQLVEQQRLLGDLPRQPRAVGDEPEQPIERGRILVQQREIRAAPADGAKHRQHALETLRAPPDAPSSASIVRTMTAARRCLPTSSMR